LSELQKGIQGWLGAGGIIIDPEGNEENSFEWELGKDTINQAKALSLYQGIGIVDERYYRKLIVNKTWN
jgi:hypothetical protein